MEGERGDQRATPERELKSEEWRSGRRIQCSQFLLFFFFIPLRGRRTIRKLLSFL